ncbi:MAG TPA: DUF488 domain-containing protein [Tepidisphaeraceae bacterium]|jgi:uncharacterized protein (DUF488 family)|nr:DUF488 domain-containing protein [Tepidisphaeraceae bacterium]
MASRTSAHPDGPRAVPASIWTIGHSTRSAEEFVEMLRQYRIDILVDVRHFPGSRRFPHFNKSELARILPAFGIRYEHLVELGGRRRPLPDSHNILWRNAAFRGYADYMETDAFRAAIDRLLQIAHTGRTAIMCSEAVWWRCHRSMISDYLKATGVRVFHILGPQKIQEHPYTSAARLVNGKLSYESPSFTPTLPYPPSQETDKIKRNFKIGDHVE